MGYLFRAIGMKGKMETFLECENPAFIISRDPVTRVAYGEFAELEKILNNYRTIGGVLVEAPKDQKVIDDLFDNTGLFNKFYEKYVLENMSMTLSELIPGFHICEVCGEQMAVIEVDGMKCFTNLKEKLYFKDFNNEMKNLVNPEIAVTGVWEVYLIPYNEDYSIQQRIKIWEKK